MKVTSNADSQAKKWLWKPKAAAAIELPLIYPASFCGEVEL
jgi:hypothetical protein